MSLDNLYTLLEQKPETKILIGLYLLIMVICRSQKEKLIGTAFFIILIGFFESKWEGKDICAYVIVVIAIIFLFAKFWDRKKIIKKYEALDNISKRIIDICCNTNTGEADTIDICKTLNIDIILLINNYYKRLENEGFFASHTRPRMTKEYFDILKPHINKKRRQK